MDRSQPLIRAKLEVDLVDRVHNDLLGAAEYLAGRVADRMAADDRSGIAFDVMASITMSAFALEAILNFFGDARVRGWKERMPSREKPETIFRALAIAPDTAVRPFSTIETLRTVRAQFAHGKPRLVRRQWEQTGRHDELVAGLRAAEAEMSMALPHSLAVEAYADVEAIWHALLDAAGISEFETFSGGSSGIEYIEHTS